MSPNLEWKWKVRGEEKKDLEGYELKRGASEEGDGTSQAEAEMKGDRPREGGRHSATTGVGS